MLTVLTVLRDNLHDNEQKIQHVEAIMGDLCIAQNDMVDSFQEQTADITWLKIRIAD